MKKNRPYYSFLDEKYENSSSEYFFESEKLDWTKEIEGNFAIIRNEFIEFFNKNPDKLKPYFVPSMMNLPKKWQTMGFLFWKLKDKANYEACSSSMKIFRKVPGLVSVSLSLMEPQSEIKGHNGDTDSIYRCHFPLSVPDKLPAVGFRVGNEERSWEEGKLMVFNDAAYHRGWNKTDHRRIVLLIDVIKPEYLENQNKICSMVLSSLTIQLLFGIGFKRKKEPVTLVYLYFFAALFYLYFSITERK